MSAKVVNREEFLHCLESIQPGLSQREIIEQSSCFCFKGGRAFSFNDEIACSMPTGLDDSLTGAVKADKLLAQLRKWTEEEIRVQVEDSEEKVELLIEGKLRSAGFRMEREISLPIDTEVLQLPEKWRSLPSDFGEAVNLVYRCASQDQSTERWTCVHIAPQWVESHDNTQACRWLTETGFKSSVLIRRSSIQHISTLGMTKVGESENWIHFKNEKGLIVSIRRYVDNYDELDKVLSVQGRKMKLPPGLAEAAEKAGEASSDNTDLDMVWIKLKPGKLYIEGVGIHSWYKEGPKKVAWTGDCLEFMIPPTVLADLVREHQECEIAEERLRVQHGKFTYITQLQKPEDMNGQAEANGHVGKRKKKAEEDEE